MTRPVRTQRSKQLKHENTTFRAAHLELAAQFSCFQIVPSLPAMATTLSLSIPARAPPSPGMGFFGEPRILGPEEVINLLLRRLLTHSYLQVLSCCHVSSHFYSFYLPPSDKFPDILEYLAGHVHKSRGLWCQIDVYGFTSLLQFH